MKGWDGRRGKERGEGVGKEGEERKDRSGGEKGRKGKLHVVTLRVETFDYIKSHMPQNNHIVFGIADPTLSIHYIQL